MKIIFLYLVFSSIFIPNIYCAKDHRSSKSRVHILYTKLQNCPLQQTPFFRINELVTALVKLDALHTPKYYWTGVARLSLIQAAEAHGLSLLKHVVIEIRKSKLSDSQKYRIYRRLLMVSNTD